MPSSIKKICSFVNKRKCARKIFIVFVTLSDLNKTSNRAVTHTYKMHENWSVLQYFKSDMHVRPTRFSILCTPADSSDKTNWCVLHYCCACLHPNTIIIETGWTTAPCPATNLNILICKSSARTKQSVIGISLKTHLVNSFVPVITFRKNLMWSKFSYVWLLSDFCRERDTLQIYLLLLTNSQWWQAKAWRDHWQLATTLATDTTDYAIFAANAHSITPVRAGVSKSDCFVSHMRTYKITSGPHYNADATMSVPELTTISFYILFPAKGIMNCRQIISSRLYVRINRF